MPARPIPDLPPVNAPANATAQEQAYGRLRQAIMIGRIAPGEALTIRGLAETLGMSPTPVREALRRLAAEGALTVLDNRRVVAPPMHARRFEELVALRVALERHAAERAFPYVNEVRIDEMVAIDRAMDQAIAEGDPERSVTLNQNFHSALYSANPEQTALPMIESVWLQLGPFTRAALGQLGISYTVDRHKEAIEALRQRDRSALLEALEADIRDGFGHLGRAGLEDAA